MNLVERIFSTSFHVSSTEINQLNETTFLQFVFQTLRSDGKLCGLLQSDPGLRDGHAGQEQRLPPGMLCLLLLPTEVTILSLTNFQLNSSSVRALSFDFQI